MCVTQVSDVVGGKQVTKDGSTAIIVELLACVVFMSLRHDYLGQLPLPVVHAVVICTTSS